MEHSKAAVSKSWWLVMLVCAVGVGALILSAPARVTFHPGDKGQIVALRSQWFRPDKTLPLRWARDEDRGQAGWGVDVGQRFELVYDPTGDGELITRPDWWRH